MSSSYQNYIFKVPAKTNNSQTFVQTKKNLGPLTWADFFLSDAFLLRLLCFLGDLNHTLYNVWWWKITCRHQKAKYVNVSLKVFYLFNFSHVWFFHSLLGCSWCMKCQKNKYLVLHVFMAKKKQYGWHGKIGAWLYNWLYSSEMIDICWRKYVAKM